MTDQERIIDKLQKLFAKANSAEEIGNEAEAMAFMAKVDELLTKYKLDTSILTLDQREVQDPMGTTLAKGKGKQRRVAWVENLSHYVAEAYHTRLVVIPGSDSFFIIGRETDRDITVYVIHKLVNFLEDECKRQHNALRYKLYHEQNGDMTGAHGFKASFFNAAVRRIRDRLREMRHEHETESKQFAVVLQQAKKEIDDWMADNFKTSKSTAVAGSRAGNALGYARGKAAGNRADISGLGVRAGGSGPKRLGSGS